MNSFPPWTLGYVLRKFSALRLFCWKLIRKYFYLVMFGGSLVFDFVDVEIVILVGIVIEKGGNRSLAGSRYFR